MAVRLGVCPAPASFETYFSAWRLLVPDSLQQRDRVDCGLVVRERVLVSIACSRSGCGTEGEGGGYEREAKHEESEAVWVEKMRMKEEGGRRGEGI